MNNPLVSIIIPCYNSERFVVRALKSVVWQTWKNWECIVIDDGSRDATTTVVGAFIKNDPRFRYVRQNNAGTAAARNHGVSLARGAYIQFLDSDDILLPEKLSMCLKRIDEGSEIDVVFTDYVIFNSSSGFHQLLPARIPKNDVISSFLFHWDKDFIIPIHAFIFKRNILAQQPFDTELHSHEEDYDCWVRIASSGARMEYIDDVLVVYRHEGTTATADEFQMIMAKIKLNEKYSKVPEYAVYRQNFMLREAGLNQKLAAAYFMRKEFKNGLRIMRLEWRRASIASKIKMFGWFILMIMFSKKILFAWREILVSKTPFRWGGWKEYRPWQPPKDFDLLHCLNADD
jgi:glycosyltransferase involved in cell wall biosynthesis